MKRIFTLLAALTLACALTACSGTGTQSNPGQTQTQQDGTSPVEMPSAPDQSAPPASSTPEADESGVETAESSVLVAYFSATGNTESIAQHLQSILNADLYEIVPKGPYTSEERIPRPSSA